MIFLKGLTQRLSVNSRKKRFVNPIQIGVTQRAKMERILGMTPAISNGHQPPRAVDPYVVKAASISEACLRLPQLSINDEISTLEFLSIKWSQLCGGITIKGCLTK